MANLDDTLTQAYAAVNRSQHASADDIACDPDLRLPFLALVHDEVSEVTEATALRRLLYLRKRAKLPCFGRRKVN